MENELVFIETINFEHLNFDIITNMNIVFYIPRILTENEFLGIDITDALYTFNKNINNFNVKLYRTWN